MSTEVCSWDATVCASFVWLPSNQVRFSTSLSSHDLQVHLDPTRRFCGRERGAAGGTGCGA
jgi:hypothetical protein